MLRSLVAVAALAAVAPAADPPPELLLVPADAAGVVHLRAADVWNSPAFAGYRAEVRKAGAKAVAALDEQFVPAPSSLDRVTGFVLLVDGQPVPVGVVRFNKPFDAKQVRAAYLPGVKPEAVGGKEFFLADDKLAVHFADDRTLVLGDRAGLTAFLGAKPAAGGKLRAALLTAGDKPFVLAVNLAAVPQVLPVAVRGQVPADLQPVLAADLLTVTASLDGAAKLSARLEYPTLKDAHAADKAVRKGLDQLKPLVAQQRAAMEDALYGKKPAAGRFRPLADLPEAVGAVWGLGAVATLEELLADPPVKRVNTALTAEVAAPTGLTGTAAVTGVAVGLLLPAVQKVREAAARSQSQNNLKQIALALHNYESVHGFLPPAAITDKKTGKRLLSWRVAVLPYLEQEALYRQFKLDEPWDSPANLPLSKVLVKTFADPRAPAEPNQTYYKAFVGGGAAFDWGKGRTLVGFADGTSNTLLVGAFGPPVVWTKPDDFEFDPNAELPDLFAPFTGLNAAFADGSVRFLRPDVDRKLLKALITASGGEDVNKLFDR